jgi:hypothetical protein
MVGTGGFDPHGSMMPDFDARADRKMRQRDIREVGKQIIAVLFVLAAAFILLALLTIATGTF